MATDQDVVLRAMIRVGAFPGTGFDDGQIVWDPVMAELRRVGHNYKRVNVQAMWSRAIKPRLRDAQTRVNAQGTAVPQNLTVPQHVCFLVGWNHRDITQDDDESDDERNEQEASGNDSQADREDDGEEEGAGEPAQAHFPIGRGRWGGKYPRKAPVLAPEDKKWRDFAREYEALTPEERAEKEAILRRQLKGLYAAQVRAGDVDDEMTDM